MTHTHTHTEAVVPVLSLSRLASEMVDHVHLSSVWSKHGHLSSMAAQVDQAAGRE